MTGSWGRKDADDFAAGLDGRVPERAAIRELVKLAEDVCAAAVAEPSPEFTATLRDTLMAEAPSVLVAEKVTARRPVTVSPAPMAGKARRRIATAVGFLVVAGGVVGIASTSAHAVPGDLLYPVKRGIENTQLALKRGDADRGSFQLVRASRRLDEATVLATRPDASDEVRIGETLDEFSVQAQAGSDGLFVDYQNTKDDAAIAKVYEFAKESGESLASLSDTVPAGATAALSDAANAVAGLTERASDLCAECAAEAEKTLGPGLRENVAKVIEATKKLGGAKPSPTKGGAGSTAGPTATPAAPEPTNGPASPAPTTAVPPAPAPSPDPTVAPPTAPPPLSGITDPLVDGLLGENGLVPGLLGGLLGPKP